MRSRSGLQSFILIPESFPRYYWNTVNGKLETTPKTCHSLNPATEVPGPEVPVAAKDDVDRVLTAAQNAFSSWSENPYSERVAAALAFASAVEHEKEAFSQVLTKEQGKPVSGFPTCFTLIWKAHYNTAPICPYGARFRSTLDEDSCPIGAQGGALPRGRQRDHC